jgi:hypothetical protein
MVIMKKIYQLGMLLSAITLFYACSDNQDVPVNPDDIKPVHEGHEYVDLGFPSGALWSTEELCVNGSYFFAWGETDPRDYYTPADYTLQAGRDSTLTKYCTKAEYGLDGMIDGLMELLPEDDPVVKHWGGKWCMPNWNELKELYVGCTWQKLQNAKGETYFLGTSKYNGKEIIVPTTGAQVRDEVVHSEGGAFYWSSTLLTDSCNHVAGLAFRADEKYFRDGKRTAGHCIRPVIPGRREVLEMVDLGLPSGIKWARENLGAIRVSKPGLYYAWGETLPKVQYSFEDYKYCSATNEDGTLKTLTKYITDSQYGDVDNLTQLDGGDDVVQQTWGKGWRMPTLADVNELLDYCEQVIDTIDGVSGTTFIGPNGNKIFLPWAGTIYQGVLEYPTRGYYWSSTLGSDPKCGEGLFISEKFVMLGNGFTRCSGRCIRPVHD